AAIDITMGLLQGLGILGQRVDPIKAQFDALRQHIDDLVRAQEFMAGWERRSNILQTLFEDTGYVKEALQREGRVSFDDSVNRTTKENVGIMRTDPRFFYRVYFESTTDGDWKQIIPDRAQPKDGWIYDWRLGVPYAMQAIALRLEIIAAI